MSRSPRVQYPGAIYHVTARGNRRQKLFLSDRERGRFVESLEKCCHRYQVRLYLFVLMSNHFHLVLETPEGNLSRFMQALQTGYSAYFNRKHNCTGHVFQGRFGAQLVEDNEYLLELSRYVHLNPVFIKSARREPPGTRMRMLRAYVWSSYPGYVLSDGVFGFVERGAILSHFGDTDSAQRRQYRKYVEAGIRTPNRDFLELLKKPWEVVGSDAFRAWVLDLRKGHRNKRGTQGKQLGRVVEPLPGEEILACVAKVLRRDVDDLRQRRRGMPDRAIAAMMLCRHGDMTQTDVARLLCLRGASGVSWQMESLRQQQRENRDVWNLVDRVERTLVRLRRGRLPRRKTGQQPR